jgi:hypothetical protein
MAPKAVDARKRSTGTGAFAAMGRSYKSVAAFHGGWRINGGYTRGPPLVGTTTRPSRRGPPAREAAEARLGEIGEERQAEERGQRFDAGCEDIPLVEMRL